MTDKNAVLQALERLGVPSASIAVGKVKLCGYSGQTQEVDICIQKKFHSGYSDFGFALNGQTETYDVVVDDMDNVGRLAIKLGIKNFSQSVKQWYAAVKAQKALKNQGLSAKVHRDGDRLVVVAQG
jgi:hypothetical protein